MISLCLIHNVSQWFEKSPEISWSLVIYKLPNCFEEPDLLCKGFFGRLSENLMNVYYKGHSRTTWVFFRNNLCKTAQTWKFVDTFMTSFVDTFMISFEIICSEIRGLFRILSNICDGAFCKNS